MSTSVSPAPVSPPVRYQTIVVGTDFSRLAATGVQAALGIARRAHTETLHVVHIARSGDGLATRLGLGQRRIEMEARAVELARRQLDAMDLGLSNPFPIERKREVRTGVPARELAQAAFDASADLMVISTHGFGALKRAFLGSVASSLIRISHCPVLIVGGERSTWGDFSNVLAAIDFSPISTRVLDHAVAMARFGRGTVRALSAYEELDVGSSEEHLLPRLLAPEERVALENQHRHELQAFCDRAEHLGTRISVEVATRPRASDAILEQAASEASDLIVLGTSGHNAWQRAILGSTATRVVAEASCPVLVVPLSPSV